MLNKEIVRTIVVGVLAVAIRASASVSAQAWLPPKGDGSVTFTYQKVDVRNHYNSVGHKNDTGHIHTHDAVMAVEYGLTDRFALDLDLTFVASKYQGLRPHGPPDVGGLFHPAFQDAHIGLRYNVLSESWALAPFIAVTLPTHDYEVRGHSAIGRGFKEVVLGVNLGHGLDALLPNSYVHLRYSFAMTSHFAGLNLNRSNADAEVGWSPARRVTLRFIAALQKTHGGFSFPQDIHDEDDFDIHDRVARSNFIQLGGGVTVAVNRSLDVHFAYAPVPVYARNTHGDKGVVIGFSWRFSKNSAYGRIAANTTSNKIPASGSGMF